MTSDATSTIPAERRRLILDAIRLDGHVVAVELATRFAVSGDTIRRDLDLLAQQGRVQRVHGGAIARSEEVVPFQQRREADVPGKRAIAAAAAALIPDDAVVVLDGGSSCLHVAEQLSVDLRATIFTPSPAAAEALLRYDGVRVELIGGQLLTSTMTTVGATALATLEQLRPDVCLLGPCGLHPEAGVTVADVDERPIKRAMLDGAVETIALASSGKLGVVLPFVVAPAQRLTRVIVPADTDDADLVAYRDQGIDIVRAAPEEHS